MEIRPIDPVKAVPELIPLLEKHADELATHRKIMQVKPDLERYQYLINTDSLVALGLFDDDGELVGYSIVFLVRNMHYVDLRMAQNDVIFIREDLRRGKWGINLILETEKTCRAAYMAKAPDPFLMTWHGKPNTAFAALMPRLGYGIQDILFSKVIS